jgi:hypothetical protein
MGYVELKLQREFPNAFLTKLLNLTLVLKKVNRYIKLPPVLYVHPSIHVIQDWHGHGEHATQR